MNAASSEAQSRHRAYDVNLFQSSPTKVFNQVCAQHDLMDAEVTQIIKPGSLCMDSESDLEDQALEDIREFLTDKVTQTIGVRRRYSKIQIGGLVDLVTDPTYSTYRDARSIIDACSSDIYLAVDQALTAAFGADSGFDKDILLQTIQNLNLAQDNTDTGLVGLLKDAERSSLA